MPRYSETVMDHFRSPRNVGVLESPDLVGIGSLAGRAPSVTLHLRIREERVCDVRFQAFGCGATIAAASMLTEMIMNRTVADCLKITPAELVEALGGLPPDKDFCATVVVTALQSACMQPLPSHGADPGEPQ